MSKTFEEVAMDVIREDWEYRKTQNYSLFNQERIARMMGISRSQFAKALGENKNPTISFICRYATAVGRPIDEMLHTIGIREVEEQRMMLIQNQMNSSSSIELAYEEWIDQVSSSSKPCTCSIHGNGQLYSLETGKHCMEAIMQINPLR